MAQRRVDYLQPIGASEALMLFSVLLFIYDSLLSVTLRLTYCTTIYILIAGDLKKKGRNLELVFCLRCSMDV